MNWNELEVVWREQPLLLGTDVDLDQIQATFESKSRRMRQSIRLRNLSEGMAGLFVVVLAGILATKLGPRAWPIWIGAAMIAGVTFRFLRDQARVAQRRLRADAPLLNRVEEDLRELRLQRLFLSGWGVWYLLPCVVAIAVCLWGIVRSRPEAFSNEFLKSFLGSPLALVFVSLILAVFVGACGLAWRSVFKNNQARVEPRIAELERLYTSLL